jgi:hypothetical protein
MSRRSLVRSSGSTVDAEVANLFKLQNKSQFTNALLHLRQKYRDEDLVSKIQDVFMQKHSSIVKSAKKFALAVRNKYAQQNIPFHQLLMKARAHAKKHHLSEAEFTEFQRIYEQELAGSGSGEVVIPMTSIMKVLGNITSGADAYFNVNEADYRNLQEIIKLNDMSKPLHAQVLLQAIQYDTPNDVALAAITFDRKINNPGDHVHPVVAALFVPKFKVVDHHFLYSNMSGIIKARYNQQPLTTRPDYELFYNLVTDPNDVVCDTRTPVADLLHRCNLQNQLWNSVLHLRNGQIYNPSLREFTASVDVCRLNKYDNPDFVYGRHDGTIIKRLFSAFSFRPTVVATLPVANLFAYNPYSQNMRPTVTSIPMINVRLSNFLRAPAAAAAAAPVAPVAPAGADAVELARYRVELDAYLAAINAAARPAAGPLGAAPAAINTLSAALSQTNQFLEGNTVVNRLTNVMYSREIIVFYVDRRAYVYSTGNTLTNLARLPTSIAGFERIHNQPIVEEQRITVGSKDFDLASAVVCQTMVDPSVGPAAVGAPAAPSEFVIGSETIIIGAAGAAGAANINPINSVLYAPANAPKAQDNKVFPVIVDGDRTRRLTQNGIIFIYQDRTFDDKAETFI